MEVQITDFENAAFSVFIVLLSRAILRLGLNFYIPISKVSDNAEDKVYILKISHQVDENMNRAQKRDAVHQQKFHFRRDVFPAGHSKDFPYTEPTPAPSGDMHKVPYVGGTETEPRPTCVEAQAAGLPSPCDEPKVNGLSSPSARPFRKENVLRNCYPDIEPPVTLERMPVEEEYEEMTIDEIINGKVCLTFRV